MLRALRCGGKRAGLRLLIGFAALSAVAPALATPAVASYTLDARLDVKQHRITGHGTLRWQNSSRASVKELWFHLYLNAFKNAETAFLRSPRRARPAGEAGAGYIEVKQLLLKPQGVDLWPSADRHSPDDPLDTTDIRVPLPEAVEPGQSVELELAFESQLPAIVARTGYSRSFHLVAQWFPKIARLEPDGTWRHFAFRSKGEFYADFGDYQVTLELPASFRVGASGALSSATQAADVQRLRYEAKNVHDFAWAAWDEFEERNETVHGVAVRLLFPAGYAAELERSLDALRAALPFYDAHYGAYAYPTLTLVHPPTHASRAAGMEYPTLITTGSPWFSGLLGLRAAEAITAHELGHQWFYGMIATDEQRFPFLDEGLCSFVEGQALEQRYGSGSLFDLGGLEVSALSLRRTHAVERAHAGSIARAADDFVDLDDLGGLAYSRTATLLATLARVYGEPQLQAALSAYATRQRFAHPGPAELLAALSEHLGAEATEIARLVLFDQGLVDFSVEHLASTPEEQLAPNVAGANSENTMERAQGWLSSVTLYRQGSLELPVDIDLIAADAQRFRRHWDGHGQQLTLVHAGPSPIVNVQIDPERKVLLDQNLLNNALAEKRSSLPRLWERALYFFELVLSLLGP